MAPLRDVLPHIEVPTLSFAWPSLGGSVSQYDVGAGGALSLKSPPFVATGNFPSALAVSAVARVPTTKEQCKNGGWRNFPQFKNQGDCVSFVETGRWSRRGGHRSAVSTPRRRNRVPLQ
jgi:hypothetical protein